MLPLCRLLDPVNLRLQPFPVGLSVENEGADAVADVDHDALAGLARAGLADGRRRRCARDCILREMRVRMRMWVWVGVRRGGLPCAGQPHLSAEVGAGAVPVGRTDERPPHGEAHGVVDGVWKPPCGFVRYGKSDW
jgi:hypothetical protein